jgi:hypothetical protein
MKEWCLLHPFLTTLILVCLLVTISEIGARK